MNRVAIVVDSKVSGLGIAANSRAKLSKHQLISVIPAMEFWNPVLLLEELIASEYESVLFAWRNPLLESLKIPLGYDKLKKLKSVSSVGVLIPDYLDLIAGYDKDYKSIYRWVDFLLFTTEQLRRDFSENITINTPSGILHDMPNVELINQIWDNNSVEKSNSLIWVGNSEWGKRQNIFDHKGLKRFFIPLVEILSKTDSGFEFEIIDSAKQFTNNRDVLEKISQSFALIQTSKSEGTGMTVLEALGVGTIPISTRTGIALELLSTDYDYLLVNQNLKDMQEKVMRLQNHQSPSVELLREIFVKHIEKASLEVIPVDIHGHSQLPFTRVPGFRSIKIRLRWILRYIHNYRSR